MARVRLEWVPIQVANLGLLGFDHLQLTYEASDMTSQDQWFVIEGIRGKPFLEALGYDGVTTLAEANPSAGENGVAQYGQDLINAIGTPQSRGSRALPLLDPFDAWQTLATHAADIDGEFTYWLLGIPGTVIPSQNSSSLIASLLYYVGIDIANNIPYGMRRTSGMHTLLGTQSDDELTTTENFTALAAGRGDDVLHGADASERFYGGRGDDLITWSKGYNLIHGGQWKLSYAEDGTDTVDYSGGGVILIQKSLIQLENAAPNYVVHVGNEAVDHLYSIERVQWSIGSDTLQLEDVDVLEDGLLFKMGAESSPQGDRIEFASATQGVLIDPTLVAGRLAISALATPDKASWIESVESVVGSGQGDKIYIDSTVHVADGGGGDDMLDARLVTAFSPVSPQGYDAELLGGEGNDTLVADAGHILLDGGAGADKFVLTAMTSGPTKIEMVITGADATDHLYIPYAFFNGTNGNYAGSQLMPVLGGIGALHQTGGAMAYFDWQTESQLWYGNDTSQGHITFVGAIWFDLDGADLMVHVYKGSTLTYPVNNGTGGTVMYTDVMPLMASETLVRVKDYDPGDLGINIYDPGTAVEQQLSNGNWVWHYTNYDTIVHTLTADGARLAALEARPGAEEMPVHDPANDPAPLIGSEGSDTLSYAGTESAVIQSQGGNDSIASGSGNDALDGGTGNDTMAGGSGDDSYVVDSPTDVVQEAAGGGEDTVYSSIDTTLASNVENLSLTDTAISGAGNALDNDIGGNEMDNVLSGGAGNDLLVGSSGKDTLIGGTGNDRYGYTPGDGIDTIHDMGSASDSDVLVINYGLGPTDVTVVHPQGAPQDLLLLLSDGGRITLQGFGVSAAESVDAVQFSDGTLWTRAQLVAMAAAAPVETNAAPVAEDDPYLAVNLPMVTIPKATLIANDTDANGDSLTITAVGSAVNCIVTLDANGDVTIETPTGFEGLASFVYTLSDSHGGTSTGTVEVGLAGAISTTLEGIAGSDSIVGTSADEVLHGNAGNDTLSGGGGADQLNGGAGIDIVSYAGAASSVNVYLGGGDPGLGDSAGDTFSSIEGIIGSNFQDGLVGTAIAESMMGGGGGDDLFGFGGNDTLDGGSGDDGVNGGDGDDVVIGGADVDSLHGDAGNDLIDAVTGESGVMTDELVGGTGNDTYIVDLMDTIYEAAGQGTDTLLARTTFTLTQGADVEVLTADAAAVVSLTGNEIAQSLTNSAAASARLVGGGGNDTITGAASAEALAGDFGGATGPGAAGNDQIYGYGGNDTIDGEAGADTLFGGDGNDQIDGGTENDQINGEIGNDTLRGGDGLDVLTAGVGNDSLLGQAGNDQLIGEAGNDSLTGGAGNDTMTGGDGSDLLDGTTDETTAARDTLTGGLGDDTYVVQVDDVIVEAAGAGADTLVSRTTYVLAQGISIESLQAATSATILTGNDLAQTLNVAAGITAELRGGGGADTLWGGTGNDKLWGDFANGTGAGTASVDELHGGAGNDTLYGEAAADQLFGEDGNDSLDGATAEAVAARDTLTGGLGNDTYVVQADDLVVEIAGGGTDILNAKSTYTLDAGVSIESIIALATGTIVTGNDLGQTMSDASGIVAELRGGGGNDTITGGAAGNDILWGDFAGGTGPGVAGADSLRGGGGNDTISGEAGNDTLLGDAGTDSLLGGDGNDSLDGATSEAIAAIDTLAGGLGDDTYTVLGDDVVQEAVAGGSDTLIAKSTYTLVGGVHVETMIAGTTGIVLTGNGQAQVMSNAASVIAELRGGGGDDTITGSSSADTLWGDTAADPLQTIGGNDEIHGGIGNDTIYGEAGADLLYGDAGADAILGGIGADTIYGGVGIDTIDGGDNPDTIWGEAGNDMLTGGTGIDRFMFRTGFGRDTIRDRVAGEILDVQGFGATYANLVFTVTTAGVEISSPLFGAGNVIVIANATQAIDQSQFLF